MEKFTHIVVMHFRVLDILSLQRKSVAMITSVELLDTTGLAGLVVYDSRFARVREVTGSFPVQAHVR